MTMQSGKGCAGACRLSIAMLCLSAILFGTGCESAGQGAVSGGAIGALSGLAIGSLSGNAGAGAAIGAVTGAVGGAVIGDQNRRTREAQEAAMQTPPPPQGTTVYVTGGPLWNLVGNWNVQDDEIGPDGNRTQTSGAVKGVVDKKYFLRLDCSFKNPNGGDPIEGTSVISQDGGDRLTMTNSFSSSPQMVRYQGKVDKSGLLFTFTQTDPRSDSPRKVSLRITGQNQWTAEVWQKVNGQDQKIESYTFTRA
jgi:hypothetical protein